MYKAIFDQSNFVCLLFKIMYTSVVNRVTLLMFKRCCSLSFLFFNPCFVVISVREISCARKEGKWLHCKICQYFKKKALLGKCELEVYFEIYSFFSTVLRTIFNMNVIRKSTVWLDLIMTFIYLFRLVVENNEGRCENNFDSRNLLY